MAGVKGRSGTNKGKDKPFAEALRMEIAAAGEDHKALRVIARNLIQLASSPVYEAMAAIKEIADRLDGKPAQAIQHSGSIASEVEMMSDDELRDDIRRFIVEAGVGASAPGMEAPPAPDETKH